MHAAGQKAWRGKGMEGWAARWYTRTRRNDMEDFRREAKAVAEHLRSECNVLEVAPGPGFFAKNWQSWETSRSRVWTSAGHWSRLRKKMPETPA